MVKCGGCACAGNHECSLSKVYEALDSVKRVLPEALDPDAIGILLEELEVVVVERVMTAVDRLNGSSGKAPLEVLLS